MFNTLRDDIQCVLDRDPAARSVLEVLLCYPGFHAIRSHRAAYWLHTHGLRTLARIQAEWCRFCTGVDIHPAAVVGRRLFIDHGLGVVIGETAVIGDDVTLYQGATLGGTGKETGKRHPTVGNHVTISAGAAVLGPVTIGDYSKIGAGAVVLHDVPRGATVVGVPGHVVRRFGCPVSCGRDCSEAVCTGEECPARAGEAGVDLNVNDLPDPVQAQITALMNRVETLEAASRAEQNDR